MVRDFFLDNLPPPPPLCDLVFWRQPWRAGREPGPHERSVESACVRFPPLLQNPAQRHTTIGENLVAKICGWKIDKQIMFKRPKSGKNCRNCQTLSRRRPPPKNRRKLLADQNASPRGVSGGRLSTKKAPERRLQAKGAQRKGVRND